MGADVVVQSNTMKSIQDSIGQPVARLGNVNAFLCLAGLFALFATSARASDPNGVYAFVDKVVFEPSEAAPERIQVWGGFAVAKEEDRDSYQASQRGYTYFKPLPKVRKAEDKPEQPDVYPKSWGGITKVSGREHGPISELGKLMGKAK